MAQRLKRLLGMQETWVRSLGGEDPLEKEMATYSSIHAWRIPWTEEPGGLYIPWGCKESDRTEGLTRRCVPALPQLLIQPQGPAPVPLNPRLHGGVQLTPDLAAAGQTRSGPRGRSGPRS